MLTTHHHLAAEVARATAAAEAAAEAAMVGAAAEVEHGNTAQAKAVAVVVDVVAWMICGGRPVWPGRDPCGDGGRV